MRTNVPFCVTLVVALFISLYMLLDPAEWLQSFMDLTNMSLEYELFLLALALVGFVIAYLAEQYLLPQMAKWVGQLNKKLRTSHQKKRKQYKVIQEDIDLST